MRLRTILAALAFGLGLAVSAKTQTAHAIDFSNAATTTTSTGIKVDGQYSDWASLPSAKVNYDSAFAHTSIIKMVATASEIDVYVEVHSANGNALPTAGWTATLAGKNIALQLGSRNQSETKSDTVFSNSRMAHYGNVYTTAMPADATYPTAYTRSEFSISPSAAGVKDLKAGDVFSISFQGTGLGSQTISTVVDSGGALSGSGTSDAVSTASSTASSSSSDLDGTGVIAGKGDTPAKGDNATANDDLGITIDGQFADWDHVTKTDEDNGNQMAMVTDGGNVYVYVMMSQYYVAQNGYKFTAGGQTFYITPQNGGNGSTSTTPVTFKVAGGPWDTSTQYPNVGNGYMVQGTVAGKTQGLMEFQFKLSDLGLSATASQTITLENSGVGHTVITAAGGSTGPVLLAGAGVLLAGFGYWKTRQMKGKPAPTIRRTGK